MVYVSAFSIHSNKPNTSNFLTGPSSSIPISKEYNLIIQMANNNTIIDIIRYYTKFSLGQYDTVSSFLNPTTYSKISNELNNLHAGAMYPNYEFILTNIIRSFESLMQSVQIYLNLQTRHDVFIL